MTQQTEKYCKRCQSIGLHARPGTNHLVHFIVTLFLCGFWIPIWILASLKVGGWRCQRCGAKQSGKLLFLLALLLVLSALFAAFSAVPA